MTLAAAALLPAAIETAVAEQSLLKHPFYRAWSAGALSKEQLAGYAKEYYWAVKHVPVILEAMERNLPEALAPSKRRMLKQHVKEESGHIALWERFSSALGISVGELRDYEPTETVRKAVSVIIETAEREFPQGVAAMYAFECDLPAISRSKIEGLKKFYGLGSEDAHAYFLEHLAEEKHLCFWRKILESKHCNGTAAFAAALASAKATVAAQNRILDGVAERYCPELCPKSPHWSGSNGLP